MTQERQREIQASLFKMLGQADDPVTETAKDDGARPTREITATSAPPQHQQQKQPTQIGSKSPSKGPVEVVTAIPFDEAG
jgi:hypothetical protein